MCSHYKIVEFWLDKKITEQGEIVDIDCNKDGELVVWDERLACCFACGKPAKKDDVLSWDSYDMELSDVWNTKRVGSKLERAHILARQFGGTDTPDNLFLLCPDCHFQSPDTKNKATFFRWVYRRKQRYTYGIDSVKFKEDLTQEVLSRGYSLEDVAQAFCNLTSDEQSALMHKAACECGIHGGNCAVSTYIGCMVDVIELNFLTIHRKKNDTRYEELATVYPFLIKKDEDPGVRKYWTIGCISKPARDWCAEYGISMSQVEKRMYHHGLTLKQALTFPKVPNGWNRRPMEYWHKSGCFDEQN